MFRTLHDLLVQKYGLESTSNISSKEALAMCDFDMRFTFVVPGWPGSVHDTRVWSDAIVRYDHFPQPPTGNISHVSILLYTGWYVVNF